MSQELCGPCKDLGLTQPAHYAGRPAGESTSGKAIPPMCRRHYFNMPLPSNIRAKIPHAPPTTNPPPLPPPEDTKRLEQITAETLDPNTPSPGHTAGCPCDRCRKAAENQKRTITVLPEDKRLTAGKDRQKEKTMTFPPCKCGCGETTKSNRSPYLRGHNPDTKKPAAKRKSKSTTPRNSRSAQPAGMVSVQVPVSHLDDWWQELPIEEKVAIYSRQFEG